jgi:ABC-type transport system involved in cytochrome c biogenesis permease subunit
MVIVVYIICDASRLTARWFILGHAPWSDAYEAIIHVAWATMFLVWHLILI